MADDTIDVAVIGGGIVGLSCALPLQARGKRVAVIDPGDARARASFGNAGVLSRGSILPVAGPGIWGKLPDYLRNRDPALRIRWASLPALAPWLWRFARFANADAVRRAASALDPLVARSFDAHLDLAREIGCAHLIRQNGWLRLYRSQAAFAASAGEQALLREHGAEALALEPEGIAELEPSLAPRFAGGIFFPQTGSVESPGELVAAYESAFVARGGRAIRARVLDLAQTENGVELRTDAGLVSAGHAILAAGAWSGELARRLGCRIPLVAERGYHQHVRLAGNAVLTRPVNDIAGGYVLSPMNGSVRILSGVELARPDDPPDHRQIERVRADAGATLPLGEPIDEPWRGSRPSTPDSLPVIGRARGRNRILFAFGHGHIGFSTGPVTGRLVADMLEGRESAIPAAPFSPARF